MGLTEGFKTLALALASDWKTNWQPAALLQSAAACLQHSITLLQPFSFLNSSVVDEIIAHVSLSSLERLDTPKQTLLSA